MVGRPDDYQYDPVPAWSVVVDSGWPSGGPVSDALDWVANELRHDPEAMVATVLAGMRREVPVYAAMPPAHAQVVEQGVAYTVGTFVSLLAERRRLRPEELEGIAAIGAVRASQGVAVDDMLEAVRVAMRWGWAHILHVASALPPGLAATAAVGRLGTEVFEYMQQSASAMARGAEEHIRRGLRSDVRGRSEVVERLLSGAFRSDDELRNLAAAVGIDVAGAYAVVVAAVPQAVGDRIAHLRTIEDDVLARYPDALGGSMRTVPLPHVALVVDPAVSAAVVALLDGAGAVLGVDGTAGGPSAVYTSYSRLVRVVDVARRIGHPSGVVDGRRLAAHRLLDGADREAARDFVDDVLGPVLALPAKHRRALLEVLEAAAVTDGTLADIGARLGIHPKTVGARLREVERLTGLHLDHLDDRFLTDLAVLLHRLHRE